MRAVIYARISLDRDGEGSGVERQLEDCRRYVADRGWVLAEEFVDNDVSAFSGRKRPEFERMLRADAEVCVVWKTDRLARRGKDLQRFLDTGMQLASCTEPEFTGSTGLLMLRVINGFAEHESGVKSERVARKMKQKAEQGDPHAGGRRMFGYTKDGRNLVPDEAERVREAARRVLSGETLSGILRDWTAQGVQRPAGGRWNPSNFSRTLRSPLYAGLREHAGVLYEGTFPAILDRQTWDRLRAVLGTKKRPGAPQSHLLAGLLKCGHCGANLGGGPTHYRCKSELFGGCGRIGIQRERVERYVVDAALAMIPERKVEPGTDQEVELLLDALRQTEADIAQLAKDHYVEKRIGRPAYLAANEELEARAELLRVQIADGQETEDFGSLDDIAEHWDEHPISWRQAVLRTVLEAVVVKPAKGTRRPVMERIELRWRA